MSNLSAYVQEFSEMCFSTGGGLYLSKSKFQARVLEPRVREFVNRKTGKARVRHYDECIAQGPVRKTKEAAEKDLEMLKTKHGL